MPYKPFEYQKAQVLTILRSYYIFNPMYKPFTIPSLVRQ